MLKRIINPGEMNFYTAHLPPSLHNNNIIYKIVKGRYCEDCENAYELNSVRMSRDFNMAD